MKKLLYSLLVAVLIMHGATYPNSSTQAIDCNVRCSAILHAAKIAGAVVAGGVSCLSGCYALLGLHGVYKGIEIPMKSGKNLFEAVLCAKNLGRTGGITIVSTIITIAAAKTSYYLCRTNFSNEK